MQLSVIIPVVEKSLDLEFVVSDYARVLKELGVSFEILIVVDGDVKQALAQIDILRNRIKNLRVFKHIIPFGEAAALKTGATNSEGEYLLFLPSHYQVESDELKKLFQDHEEYDLVYARRHPRVDSFFDQVKTKAYHFFIRSITADTVHDTQCAVRLLKKSVFRDLRIYGDLFRFLPIIALREGYRAREIDLKQRRGGDRRIKFNPLSYYKKFIDLLNIFFLYKFTRKPLRFFGAIAMWLSMAGVVVAGVPLFQRVFLHMPLANRPMFLIGTLLFVLGIQILAIGLIGEIIIFTHASENHEYTIAEIYTSTEGNHETFC